MYYDFDSLYFEAQGGAFASGKRRFYDNKVKNISTTLEDGKLNIYAAVDGDSVHNARITFDEQGGLYDYSCDCEGFNLESGPCKHIIAAALSFEERNPTSPTASRRKSDAGALALIAEYNKKKHRKMMTSDAVKCELVPHVELNGLNMSLRFTIGAGKKYNLKDVADFVSAFESSAYRRYGVGLELYHTPENFTDAARRLIDFVVKCYTEKAEINTHLNKYKDELRLLSGDVDEFFALYEGALVHVGRSDMALVRPFDTALPLKLVISETDDGFEVTLSDVNYKFIDGRDYKYVLIGSEIYRISIETADAVREFCDTVHRKQKLYVAESDMSAFYNSVIAKLSGHLDLDSGGFDLTVYEAAPLVTKIYINGKDGDVYLDVEASYDDKKVDLFSDYVMSDFVRDWDQENELRGVLAKYFPHYPDLYINDEADIFRFLSEGVKELFGYAEVFVTESMKRLRVRQSPHIHVGVRLTGDLLRLELEAEDYTYDEITAILNAYREKKKYIRLGGGFVSLEDNSIAALGEILEVAKATDYGFEMPKYYAPYVSEELSHGFFSLSRDSTFKSLIKELGGAANAEDELNKNLNKVMRNYQKTGYRWLKTLKGNGFGGILADDMGLGKSLQVIALLLSEKSRTIIVCPTTLILNWVSELKKFAPSLKALTVMGSQDERRAQIASLNDYDVVITSYDLMRRDFELYEDVRFDYAIADEAQYIKNAETKNAMAVKRINAAHRFALTGTPIENNLGELWSIFDFIMPGYLGTYESFKDKFEMDIVHGGGDAAERLQRIVKPFILRRLKSDVLTELPPKVESVNCSPLEGEQKRIYDANLATVRESMRVTPQMNRVMVLSMLTKLRQICCDPSLVYPDYEGNSAKLDACMELIDSAVEGGHKVLLFSQFTSMLDIIRRKLMEKGVSHYLLTGSTSKPERMRLVSKFNENDTKVFLISLKAGGTGINLTGADVVIHYDPWWNESVMNQATDRAYRMGQNKSVQVYKLVVKDSLEEKIMELQEKKTALSTKIVGKENDLKEILALLSE